MKKLIWLVLVSVLLFSCQKGDKKTRSQSTKTQVVEQAKDSVSKTEDTTPKYNNEPYNTKISDYDYTAPYICPNHCPGSGSDKPGKCPVCGMDLIPNPDYQKDSVQ